MALKTATWTIDMPQEQAQFKNPGLKSSSNFLTIIKIENSSFVETASWYLTAEERIKDHQSYLGLFLRLSSSSKPKIAFEFYQFLIIDPKTDKIVKTTACCSKKLRDRIWVKDEGFGYPDFLSTDELYKNRELYFPDGKLHVMVAISFFIRHEPVVMIFDDDESQPPLKKCKTMNELFESMIVQDVTLKLSDGTELKAEMKKLTESSTIFAELLTSEKMKQSNGILEVPDISREVMIEFLRFLYCGEVADISKVNHGLFIASSKYKIKNLQDLCAASIKETDLNSSNAVYYAEMAINCDDQELLNDSCKFIKLFYKFIKKTEQWIRLSHRKKCKILEAMAELTCENEVVHTVTTTANAGGPQVLEVAEVHNSSIQQSNNVENIRYIIKPTARFKPGMMILVDNVVQKATATTKFNQMKSI